EADPAGEVEMVVAVRAIGFEHGPLLAAGFSDQAGTTEREDAHGRGDDARAGREARKSFHVERIGGGRGRVQRPRQRRSRAVQEEPRCESRGWEERTEFAKPPGTARLTSGPAALGGSVE